ncbi:MAG: hypothetical protein ACC742_15735 [Thermoanaerobaculales bacterium]
MRDIEILPLIVGLRGTFFRSSRDALDRAEMARQSQAAVEEPTGLNIFQYRHSETQAVLESVVFSFLTVEADINSHFFDQQGHFARSGLDKWLRKNWRRLSILDKFQLLRSDSTEHDRSAIQELASLFSEFASFRNRLVHARPEVYDALVQRDEMTDEAHLHDVEPTCPPSVFRATGFSSELGRIHLADARRAFEIMLLMVCFHDEQLVVETALSWPAGSEDAYAKPRSILDSLPDRYYSHIDLDSFVPEFIRQARKSPSS